MSKPLPSWNDGAARQALLDFAGRVAAAPLAAVLLLRAGLLLKSGKHRRP